MQIWLDMCQEDIEGATKSNRSLPVHSLWIRSLQDPPGKPCCCMRLAQCTRRLSVRIWPDAFVICSGLTLESLFLCHLQQL